MSDCFQSVRRDGKDAVAALKLIDNINITNDAGENLLHVAIAYSNIDAAVELINLGVDVNAQDRKGRTPLHYAGVHHSALVAREILRHGGNINVADEHGNTPLWAAAFNARGEYDVVEVLVEHGAATVANRKNIHGRSPIDFGNQIGDRALVEMISRTPNLER